MASPPSNIILADGDNFKGVIIKPHHYEKFSKEEFKQKLSDSLVAWKSEGRRGVWLSIPLMRSELISVAAELGFQFHHSKPDMVAMTTWLSDEECTLPIYATHNIGVAGFVVNDRNEVLLVQEKWQRDIKLIHWKLPGGVAEQGEDLWQTAIRETFEETGIRAEFVAMFTFRHMHGYKWGTDDLYFTCLLRPLNTEVNPNLSEIAAVKWMSIEDYIADPATLPTNRWIAESYLESVKRGTMIQPTLYPHFYPQKPPISLYRITACDTKEACDLAPKKWSRVEKGRLDKAVHALSKPKI